MVTSLPSSSLLLERLPSPLREAVVLGYGTKSVVVESPWTSHCVVKLTWDSTSYGFLKQLSGTACQFRHLPRVSTVLDPHESDSDQLAIFGVELERLEYQKCRPQTLQTALHKAWIRTVSSSRHARVPDVKKLPIHLRTSELIEALAFINEYTLANGGYFDGDTFSNCMFRQNGDFVLVDPVTNPV